MSSQEPQKKKFSCTVGVLLPDSKLKRQRKVCRRRRLFTSSFKREMKRQRNVPKSVKKKSLFCLLNILNKSCLLNFLTSSLLSFFFLGGGVGAWGGFI